MLETLAQELYRLVHAPQPKTRIAISTKKTGVKEYYVLSKKIPEFTEFFLSEKNSEKILNNSITGLAATQVLALWLNEIDFKSGNVGIDKDGHIIKIDGGLSLVKLNPKCERLHKKKNLNITRADLEALPNLQTYEACNWLHHIYWDSQRGAMKEDPTPLDKQINQSLYFKLELYRTILHIISLPDVLIEFFTKNYIKKTKHVAELAEFIITRKKQLKMAAEQIPAFNEYRQSNLARVDVLKFLNYLEDFKTMCKSFLLSKFEDEYKINLKAILLGDVIKEYTLIKNFAREFEEFDKDKSFFDQLKKFKPHIKSVHKIINEYLNSPMIPEKEDLYKQLKQIKKDLEEEKLLENEIISKFIALINNVLSTNHNLMQEKNTTQPLPPISTFFNRNHQKILITDHQQGMSTQLTNFLL